MNARAIALDDQCFTVAFGSTKFRTANARPDAHRSPHACLPAVAQAFGDRAGVLMVKGGPDVIKAWAGQRDQLADAGWTCTDIQPWTSWKHPDRPAVHVGMTSSIDYDRTPLFGPKEPAANVVRRLAWIEEVIGAPYRMTPGVTGHAAIRTYYADRPRRANAGPRDFSEPYWGVGSKRESDDRRNGSGDLIWHRRPQRADTDLPWVHSYDLNAARLSASNVAELAWGKLKRHDGPFDPRQAGYWLVHAHDITEPFPGAIYDRADVDAGMVALTTPMMEFLLALGACPTPAEAFTATGRRILRPIAERWNTARLAAPPGPALNTVKAIYREAAGLFASNGGSIVRHDWYHTIMDRQRATVLGHILRIKRTTGLMPLMVHTDCLWYPSDDADPTRTSERLGIRLGTGLGAFRTNTTTPAAQFYKKR